MPYVGSQPTVGNFVKLDAITTSATATFNLTNGGIAYSPQSANHCIVSLNGVIQEPTSASNVGGFTISGSTIVFTSALTSNDVIDFILVLGDVLNIGTPSDGTVTFPKVTSNLITGATAETSIAGGDSVLIYDDSASALRKMTRTNFVAGVGNNGTPYFSAKGSGTYSLSHNVLAKVQYATELFDSDGCYDNATNYRFTPTTAGYYHLGASILIYLATNNVAYAQLGIYKNGTAGTKIAESGIQRYDGTGFVYAIEPFCSGFAYANGTSDYFEVFCQPQGNGSSSVNVDAANTFSFGYRIA